MYIYTVKKNEKRAIVSNAKFNETPKTYIFFRKVINRSEKVCRTKN